MGFLSKISSRMEEIVVRQHGRLRSTFIKGTIHMSKKGIFNLSNITDLLNKMLLVLNPPLRNMERVLVRVEAQQQRKKY